MPFVYPTVTINAVTYNVYADVPLATQYLGGSMASPAGAWLGTDATTQGRSLVASTRWLDAYNWVGTQSDPTNALQWPRAGVAYVSGQPVSSTSLPLQLQAACAELASMLVDNPDLRDELQNPTPRELHAGSVGLSFFRPLGTIFGAKDIQVLTPFPQSIMDLIGMWLVGTGATTLGAIATGTDADGYEVDYGLEHGM